jgi:regulator of replication initiation timing
MAIPDPTYELKTDLAEVQQQCSKLQHSLTQALNEADELKTANAKLKKDLELAVMNAECFAKSSRDNLSDVLRLSYAARELQAENETKDKMISDLISDLASAKNDVTVANACISELEAQNELAIEALTDVAKQLGFESFVYEDVMSAIADLYTQIEGREAALRGSGKLHKDRKEVVSKLEDNLTRANSDRLSELTTIMRMLQALEDTPQDKIDGAIYLIKRVIYDAICKLDPNQSWDA